MAENHQQRSAQARSQPLSSFIDRRVNPSTFLIIEDDGYNEQPHIYVKICPDHLLITDTGCNTPRSKTPSLTSLREYLETYPLPTNNLQCLNPNGHKRYIIICSHCHYDHILGIPSFLPSNPHIIASSFQRSFILSDLPTNSLCSPLGIPTPQYTISHWARHLSHLTLDDTYFRIQFLHIPGHTPDSLAWYDIDENHLYVGDSFYERLPSAPIPELPSADPDLDPLQGAIIFPNEGGNWIDFMKSLDTLLSFIQHKNKTISLRPGTEHRVRVSCGHLTYNSDAEDIVTQVQTLFQRIIAGRVTVSQSLVRREVLHDFWLEEGSRFGVLAPRRLVEEARENFVPKGDI